MVTKLKLILLLTLFLISPVSAKFICGEVASSDITTPSWYDAKVYLTSNPTYSSSCKVSPSNYKYCCDIDSIKDNFGYSWKSGDTFSAKITDKASGYFAPPQNLTITGEGYDIAPILTLEKAIQITNPNTTLTISQTPTPIKINISSHCTNTISSQANTTFGKNEIEITTTCNDEQFYLQQTFFIIQDITFQKEYPKRIPNKETTTISLQADLSHKVENIQLQEYVPTSWEISNISNNGTLQESTPQYNVITWQVTGNNFSVSFKAHAPETGIVPKHFTFKTQIDQHDLIENTIQVYKIIPIPHKPRSSGGGYVYHPKKVSKVSPILPLIIEEPGLIAALYSKIPKEQGSFDLLSFLYEGKIDRKFDYLKSYQVQTTLNSTERGKMIIEYDANKTFIEENDYKEIGFFKRHENKFLRITGAVISSDADTIKYRLESEESPSEIFILAEKNKMTFWDKILNLWDKIL